MEVEVAGREVDINNRPRKRPRCTDTLVARDDEGLISHLPDECMLEIFSFIPSFKDRCSCAAVSKKWLILQASMNSAEFKSSISSADHLLTEKSMVTRYLEGMKANDARLAAYAVGIGHWRVLSHLYIRGNLYSQGVTDLGLQIIATACPNLKSLSLWDCCKIGDKGLSSISGSCCSLENLELLNCPLITDEALIGIAKNCTHLRGLSIDSCQLIGDHSLLELSNHSSNLRSIALANCPAIGDDGVVSLVSNLPKLGKMVLVSLRISDCVLQAMSKNGSTIKNLVLENVLSFSKLCLSSNLESLRLKNCSGLSDANFPAMGVMLTALKKITIMGCNTLTDKAVIDLTQVARSIESIKLESCHNVSSNGLVGIFNNCNHRLKLFSLVKCHGLQGKGLPHCRKPLQCCQKLESLTLEKCAGIDDSFLAWLGTSCVGLKHIDLVGLPNITDGGIQSLFKNIRSFNNSIVESVNFSGCLQLTDLCCQGIAIGFGKKLKSVRLGGCEKITDKSLQVIVQYCLELQDLDLSRCDITDEGFLSLVEQEHQRLEVLSLEGCLGITDRALDYIELMCNTLVGLNLKHCPLLSKKAIWSVKKILWWCVVLFDDDK